MANEAKITYASQVTLEASGASAASNAFAPANDAALTSANHSDYPLGDFALTCDFGAAVPSNSIINLYRQDLNIDGAADSPAPATTYKSLYVGSFMIPSGQSASATYPLPDVPLAKECQFSVENSTIQNLSAGWVLKVTPKTFVPGV